MSIVRAAYPTQQRKAFASVKPVNAVLARFLRAVERLARQYTHDTPLSRAVRSVFVKYDVDGSGLIDTEELTSVIVDLINADGGGIDPGAAATAAAQMMKMLTTSTGGTEQSRLSEPAFLGWVHKGTKMTGAKRRAFAKQSESRRAMVLLLRTVEVRARQEIWTPEKNTLHKLFQKFDGESGSRGICGCFFACNCLFMLFELPCRLTIKAGTPLFHRHILSQSMAAVISTRASCQE